MRSASPRSLKPASSVTKIVGNLKQGAGYGYTHVLGCHPLLATRAETGETLHVRFRKGSANSGRGAEHFVREVVGRVRRAGAGGPLTLRCDSGFFSQYVMPALTTTCASRSPRAKHQ
jgi:hypothetical protein